MRPEDKSKVGSPHLETEPWPLIRGLLASLGKLVCVTGLIGFQAGALYGSWWVGGAVAAAFVGSAAAAAVVVGKSPRLEAWVRRFE